MKSDAGGSVAGMILAAGLGTRLRPLTDELPKPLVPVGDASMLAHVARWLRAGGCDRLVANAHHHAAALARAAAELDVVVSEEATILGTGGGVAAARRWLGEGEVVVWNGDILAPVDVRGLVAARRSVDALAAWAVAPRERGAGTVGVDADGRVVRVRDVRAGLEVRGGDFLGISALSSGLVRALPTEGCLVGDVLGPAIARGERVVAFDHGGPWDDVGTPRAYLAANLRWLAERGLPWFVGPSADRGDAELDRVVLGAGARVAGTGVVSRVVAWPGATVEAPLSDAIVTPAGVVRAG
jgi:mannose-1-phosphate guanylyltransferase